MKNFIVQFRRSPVANQPEQKLEYLMDCYAKTSANAIIQGAQAAIRQGIDVVEIVATPS